MVRRGLSGSHRSVSTDWQATTQPPRPAPGSPQTDAGHYRHSYDTKQRLASYWHQIDEVLSFSPSTVLEVGVGNGFVTGSLRREGIEVRTMDVAPDLEPDILGSVTDIPLPEGAVDVALCCQVLEHLPFPEFPAALRELARVASKGLVISLPDQQRYIRLLLQTRLFKIVDRLITLPAGLQKTPRPLDPQHFWEIGCGDVSLGDVMGVFEEATGHRPATYRVPENPYHRFFICRFESR